MGAKRKGQIPYWGNLQSARNTIHTEAYLVKLRHENSTLYQDRMNAPGARSRGYVEFRPDQYRIVLGKNADLSTLIHETGHVFEEELRRIVASGQADERQIADLQIFDKWLVRMDGDGS